MKLFFGSLSVLALFSFISPSEIESYSDEISLHEWTYAMYSKYDYKSFKHLKVVHEDIDVSDFDQELLNACIFYQTNHYREKHGRSPFIHSKGCEKAATEHSLDMANHDFFSHDNPKNARKKKFWQRLEIHGVEGGSTAENIAYRGQGAVTYWHLAHQFLHQWIHSPGHKKNIMNSTYKYLGCGGIIYKEKNDTYFTHYKATQNFSSVPGKRD
jgi:uncharacterized protein YkwD